MNKTVLGTLGVIFLAFSFAACGSSSGGTGTGGSSGTGGAGGAGATVPTVASSCTSYCTKNPSKCPNCAALSPVLKACFGFCIAERDCKEGTSIEDCMGYRCIEAGNNGNMSLDTLSAGCQAATTSWFNCLAKQSKVCDGMMANQPGDCTAEATALGNCT